MTAFRVIGAFAELPHESVLRNIEKVMMNMNGRRAVTNAQSLLDAMVEVGHRSFGGSIGRRRLRQDPPDAGGLRGSRVSRDAVGRLVRHRSVELCFAAFRTCHVAGRAMGLVPALLRVIFKLFLNVFAVTILLLYTQSIGSFAKLAAKATLSSADLRALRNPIHVVHTSGALLVLPIATTLSVYKPRGMTREGRGAAVDHVSHPREAEASRKSVAETRLAPNRSRARRINSGRSDHLHFA